MLRIKIVDAKTEQPITDRQILIRICGYVVSSVFFFLGFFWIGVDKRRQGWHDKMADTLVVVVPWKQNLRSLFPHDMASTIVEIVNKKGLHARAAAKFVKVAGV